MKGNSHQIKKFNPENSENINSDTDRYEVALLTVLCLSSKKVHILSTAAFLNLMLASHMFSVKGISSIQMSKCHILLKKSILSIETMEQ